MSFIDICYHNVGKKFNPGVPSIGIELDTVAIRDAKSKLRKAIPKGLSEPQVTTDKPHLKPDEVQSVGGIKAMIQGTFSNKFSFAFLS